MTIETMDVTGALVGPRIDEETDEKRAPAAQPAGAAGRAIAAEALWTFLTEVGFLGKLAEDATIRLGDSAYYLPRRAEIARLLARSRLNRRKWLEERHDCDDFAYVLKGEASSHSFQTTARRFGLCVGIVWGDFDWVEGFHAANWVLTSDAGLLLIEPQNDAIFAADRCVGGVTLLLV